MYDRDLRSFSSFSRPHYSPQAILLQTMVRFLDLQFLASCGRVLLDGFLRDLATRRGDVTACPKKIRSRSSDSIIPYIASAFCCHKFSIVLAASFSFIPSSEVAWLIMSRFVFQVAVVGISTSRIFQVISSSRLRP